MTDLQMEEVSEFLQKDEENYGIFAVMCHGIIQKVCMHAVEKLKNNHEDRGKSAVLIAAMNVMALETIVAQIIHEPYFVDGHITESWKTLAFNSLKNMSHSFATFLELIEIFPELGLMNVVANLMSKLKDDNTEDETNSKFEFSSINEIWNMK